MGEAIGAVLPLALGIAVSPIPIIAAILMLLSPHARSTGLGFLGGWVGGIVVAVVLFTLLSTLIPAGDPDASKPVAGVIKIVLGLALLGLALRQWRGRPKPGDAAVLPKWMSAIDTMTPGRALAIGFLLSAVNPKNLLMAVGAGVDIGGSGLEVGGVVVVIVIFVLLASASVAVPVVGYLAASDRMRSPLESMRAWLGQNNAAVMTVLLTVIGVVMIGKGIGSF
jgi:threonine/homoserine/homoserine lactone efflux protein